MVANFLQVDSVDGSFGFLLPPQAPSRELLIPKAKEDYFHIHTHRDGAKYSRGNAFKRLLSFFKYSVTAVELRAIVEMRGSETTSFHFLEIKVSTNLNAFLLTQIQSKDQRGSITFGKESQQPLTGTIGKKNYRGYFLSPQLRSFLSSRTEGKKQGSVYCFIITKNSVARIGKTAARTTSDGRCWIVHFQIVGSACPRPLTYFLTPQRNSITPTVFYVLEQLKLSASWVKRWLLPSLASILKPRRA